MVEIPLIFFFRFLFLFRLVVWLQPRARPFLRKPIKLSKPGQYLSWPSPARPPGVLIASLFLFYVYCIFYRKAGMPRTSPPSSSLNGRTVHPLSYLFIGLWHALSLGPEYLDLGLEGRLSFLHYSSSGQLLFFEG